jgi:arylsulfatase A-like enzyme
MAVRTIYGRKFERRILSRLYRDTWGRKRADDVNEDLLDWLDEQQRRPFFAFLNYMDAHSPYVSPPPHHTMFMNSDQRVSEDDASFIPSQGNPGSADLRELWVAGYDGGLNYLDTELGKLFNELQRRGLLDNTLIVLTSDHGEAFGEHGFYEHGHSLYREILHVPLIIRFPAKIPKGLRVSSTVSIRDIPATITSLVSHGEPQRFPGKSMAAFWSAQSSLANSEPDPALAEIYGDMNVSDVSSKKEWAKSFVSRRWHCIIYESGQAELYDLQKDPKETRNLADTPAGASVVEGFKARLRKGLSG